VRAERGASQILFGFLPQQTADLDGGVWRVSSWVDAVPLDIDKAAVRAAVSSALSRWSDVGKDDGLKAELLHNADFDVVGVHPERGVLMEEFPRVWRCRTCHRVDSSSARCRCGSTNKVQIPLVSYHECGAVTEPQLPQCPTHHEIAMERRGTTALSELRFFCPVCHQTIKWGFVPRRCSCGSADPVMKTTVHRAASVYSPHFAVAVNAPDPALAARMRAAGGGARAAEWVLSGMPTADPFSGRQTVAGMVAGLVAMGLSQETAREFSAQAASRGEVDSGEGGTWGEGLTNKVREEAEEEALSLATAVAGGRVTLDELKAYATPPLRTQYEAGYEAAVARGGLEAVDLLTSFPVLTVAFGYSRDSFKDEPSRLVPFRERGRLRLLGAVNRTEALLFRLNPTTVLEWLARRGVCAASDEARANPRLALLSAYRASNPRENPIAVDFDRELYRLLHSFSHRTIRRLAAFAGIERDGLSEYLLPAHLSFVVYAAARGDFVLGGLQAVFETALDSFLEDVVGGEARCALDPGCRAGGGACMACLHLGEPSCRWFNGLLDRDVLFGESGYLIGAIAP